LVIERPALRTGDRPGNRVVLKVLGSVGIGVAQTAKAQAQLPSGALNGMMMFEFLKPVNCRGGRRILGRSQGKATPMR